jgi:hypothetical protein
MNEVTSLIREGQFITGMSGSHNDVRFSVSLIEARASATEVSLDPKGSADHAAFQTFFPTPLMIIHHPA